MTLSLRLNRFFLSTLCFEAGGQDTKDRHSLRVAASCLPAQGSDWSCFYLPKSQIIASCSWPHQGENLASLCIVTKTTAGRAFTQRALPSTCIHSYLVAELTAWLFRHCLQSSGPAPWYHQTTPRRPWGVCGCPEPAALLDLVAEDAPC